MSGSGCSNVLALHVWVEDVYESCVAPNDSQLTAYQMMCAVERAVATELLALDYLDQKHVKKARKAIYQKEKDNTKDADDAQKKVSREPRRDDGRGFKYRADCFIPLGLGSNATPSLAPAAGAAGAPHGEGPGAAPRQGPPRPGVPLAAPGAQEAAADAAPSAQRGRARPKGVLH